MRNVSRREYIFFYILSVVFEAFATNSTSVASRFRRSKHIDWILLLFGEGDFNPRVIRPLKGSCENRKEEVGGEEVYNSVEIEFFLFFFTLRPRRDRAQFSA